MMIDDGGIPAIVGVDGTDLSSVLVKLLPSKAAGIRVIVGKDDGGSSSVVAR